MKWIFLILIIVIGYMIYTGNMGGARDATQNYVDIRGQKNASGAEGRPSPMHQYIEYNKQKKQEGK